MAYSGYIFIRLREINTLKFQKFAISKFNFVCPCKPTEVCCLIRQGCLNNSQIEAVASLHDPEMCIVKLIQKNGTRTQETEFLHKSNCSRDLPKLLLVPKELFYFIFWERAVQSYVVTNLCVGHGKRWLQGLRSQGACKFRQIQLTVLQRRYLI